MLKDKLAIYLHRRKWRRRNTHNMSVAVNIFNPDCVNVGKYTYGGIRAYTYDILTKLNIGNYCSIGPDVSFIVSAEHNLNHISSYPFKVKILGERFEGVSKGDIAIDDDVWIGCGATILSGVHIHQGAVVAAGAVVDRDVAPYAIVGGVPAKVIRYRFDQAVTDFLLTLDYGKLDSEIIQSHADELYKPIDGMELDDIKKQYSWFPKRSRD